MLCSICSDKLDNELDYPGLVCEKCDEHAIGASGSKPVTDPSRDSGENPVFIRGMRCYRRYRFGGWVTMVDQCDCECRDVLEFQDTHITGERMRTIIDRAADELERNGKPVRGCFATSDRDVPRSPYRGIVFEVAGQKIAAVRTSLVSTNARLIDATVALRLTRQADFAVAILDPPAKIRASKVTEEYRTRYAAWAWHALRVVWTTKDQIDEPWKVTASPPPLYADWLDNLRDEVDARIKELPAYGGTDSRLAEQHVLPCVHEALRVRGFERAKATSYESFWRRPQADGIWTRQGDTPHRVALEVKVTEDAEAPFCQVMENLGISDCVLYVRIASAGSRRVREALRKFSPEALLEKERFVRSAPVRFLDIEPAE